MRLASRSRAHGPEWLSLGEASRLLGVSAATVRRWSDAGRLPTFTTPGGHRRFSRASLERMLPVDRPRRPPLEKSGLTPARLTRAYRREGVRGAANGDWLATLDQEDRDAFRSLGQRLAWALVAHLDAADDEARRHQLTEATAAAADYGRKGASLGLSLSDVVEGFLAFRRPFLAEISGVARRRGFDAGEVGRLHDDADRALDRLLVATMAGHRTDTLRTWHEARDAPDAPDAVVE